ncbi:MAG: hypothetical protein ACR2FK_06740, partial [Sphingomicrobium sp.]
MAISVPQATPLQLHNRESAVHTERMNPRFSDLDAWPTVDAVIAMFEGQLSAAAVVGSQVEALSNAAEEAAARLRQSSGRIVYL